MLSVLKPQSGGPPILGSTGAGISLADTAKRPIDHWGASLVPPSPPLSPRPRANCEVDAESAAVTPKKGYPCPRVLLESPGKVLDVFVSFAA